MQAITGASLQDRRGIQSHPQKNPSSLQPVPTSQSGYYSAQLSAFSQHNAQYLGSTCSASSQPNSGSSSQTAYHNRLQQQTQFSNNQSTGLNNGQYFVVSSQPNGFLANVQPNSVLFTSAELVNRPSDKVPCPNVTLLPQQQPTAYQNGPSINLNYNAQSSQTNGWGYTNMTYHQNVSGISTSNSSLPVSSSGSPTYRTNMTYHQNVSGISTSNSSLPVSSSGSPIYRTNQTSVSVPSQYQQHNRLQSVHQAPPQTQQMAPNVSRTAQMIYMNQGKTIAGHNGATNDSTAQPPAVSQVPMMQAMPPPYRASHALIGQGQSQYNTKPIQNTALIQQQQQSHRLPNINIGQNQVIYMVPKGQSLSLMLQPALPKQQAFVVPSQSEQNANQASSVSFPVQKIQQDCRDVSPETQTSQAIQHPNIAPFSDHHSKTNLPSFNAHQYNRDQRGLQSNRSTDVLTRMSQDASCTGPSGAASLPAHSGLVDHLKVKLLSLLVERNKQFLSHDGSTASTSTGKKLRTTAGKTETVAEHSRAQLLDSYKSVLQNPSEGEFLPFNTVPTKGRSTSDQAIRAHGPHSAEPRVEGAQCSRLQMSSDTIRGDQQMSNKRHGEVEHCTDPADCLEVIAALQREVRQVCRAIAVVPPISQQADHGKKDALSVKDDDLSLKIGAFWTVSEESESKETDTNAKSLPREISRELNQTQNGLEPITKSTVGTGNSIVQISGKSTATGSQNLDSAQIENETGSRSQSSSMHEVPMSSADLMAKHLEPTKDVNVATDSFDAVFDFSTVPVINFTLEKIQHMVNCLEAMPSMKENELATNVIKRIVDLYWGGEIQNLAKEVKISKWFKLVAEMCVKEEQAVVFQFIEPNNLKKLESHYILRDETVIPVKTFTSSWLNVDENPPDIDMVLAEPISDYVFPWCKDASSTLDGTVNPEDHLVHIGDGTVQINSNEKKVSGTILHDPAITPADSIVQLSGNDVTNQDDSKKRELSENTLDAVKPVDSVIGVNDTANLVGSTEIELSVATSENIEKNVSSDLFSPSHIARSESNEVTEQKMPDENEVYTGVSDPASHLSDSYPFVENYDNSCVKKDLSNSDSFNDAPSMDVILLSADDATTIFKEQKESGLQHDLAIFSNSQLDNLSGTKAIRSFRPSKFTCPHVIDDGDHFCSVCWEDTPLLDVDLDDPLSPKDDGCNVTSSTVILGNESCSPQSGRLTKELTEPLSPYTNGEVTAVLLTSKAGPSEVTRFSPKPDDQRQSFSPKTSKVPLPETLQSVSSGNTHPVTVEDREFTSPTTAELSKTQIKIIGGQSTATEPGASTMDETSAKPEVSSDTEPIPPKNLTPQTSEGPECCPPSNSDASQQQEHNVIKQTRRELTLYGCRGGTFFAHQCHEGGKSSAVPVYLKVSSRTNISKSYTDSLSAKQKIYKQWFSSYVEKQNSSSHKRQKQCKNELKKAIEIQKGVMKGRTISISESEKSVKRGLKHKTDFPETLEVKKLKCTRMEDYFGCA